MLEGDVCELINMIGIVNAYYGTRVKKPNGDDYHVVHLSNDEFEELEFGLYEVENRARRLKAAYYAAIEDGKAVTP